MHTRSIRAGTTVWLLAIVALVVFISVLGLTATLSAALATTFTVTTTLDAQDAVPGDGACETAPGSASCSLRAAIQESNALPGADVIILPAGMYTLTLPGILEDEARYGDLDILDDLTLQGAGADVTIVDGNQLDRVFHLLGWTDDVEISAVTIRNGNVEFPQLEATDPTGQAAESGGCIFSRTRLTLRESIVAGCSAGWYGGGIYTETELLLEDTTVRDNQAALQGGGLYVMGPAFLPETPTPFVTPTPPVPTVIGTVFATPTPAGTPVPVTPPPLVTATAPPIVPTNTPAPPPAGLTEVTCIGSRVLNNTSELGGGIFHQGALRLEDCVVDGNRARFDPVYSDGGRGGGIYSSYSSALTIVGGRISANAADGDGGGIYNLGIVDITRSLVDANHSGAAGGGVFNVAWLAIRTTSVWDNLAVGDGGGLASAGGYYALQPTIWVERSTISGNISHGNGAGIYASQSFWYRSASLELINSTVSGNLADGSGGGIYSDTGEFDDVLFSNVTISNNVADADADEVGDGGGLFNRLSAVRLGNSILAGNEDRSPTTQRPDCRTSRRVESRGYNLIGNVSTCPLVGVTTGNLLGVDPLLGPLQDNGGSTQTQALLNGSPAIDAGNPAGCSVEPRYQLVVDQRGYMRPVDGNGDGQVICDMGAYEARSAIPTRRYLPVVLAR